MTSGWIFFIATTLICIGAFLNGWRFARGSENPQVRRMGRIHMIFVPPFWLLATALSFGLLGPVQGIETIKFN